MLKRIIAIILSLFAVLNLSVFAAEGTSAWADTEVAEALSLGFVPAELQSDYTSDITRAEFAHIAVSFLNIIKGEAEVTVANAFTDTADPYVNTAYAMGIISGRGDGTFAPDDNITRQEAAKVIANTYRIYIGSSALVADEVDFADNSEIAAWAYEDIGILCRRDIMRGTGDKFEPLGLYTREQSIVTFLRLFKFLQKQNAEPAYDGKNPQIKDFLKVKDGKLTSGGKEIVLNGINLGGWMIMETWMSPIIDENQQMAYSDVIKILEKRFGKDKAAELVRLYEDSFITESDFNKIEKLGFNCIRLPFWYRNFMDTDGKWLDSDPNQNPGFARLDWVVEQCEKHGLWLILDMHGCPGGQSMNHSTGIMGTNGLYNNETNLSRMESIWIAIAERYKDTKCIAAYDIMNEPQNNSGYSAPRAWQAESKTAVELTNAVYDRMIKAIRKIDKNHIISVEGVWTTKVLPDPDEYRWENMMYQLHIYDDTKGMIDYRAEELLEAREEWGVAVLVGEYNSSELENYAAELYDKNKISRLKWTYKVLGDNWGNWGLFSKAYKKADIEKASFEEIKKAFGADMLTENGFELNVKEYNDIRR